MESRLRKKRKIRLKGTLLENQIYTTLDMSSSIQESVHYVSDIYAYCLKNINISEPVKNFPN